MLRKASQWLAVALDDRGNFVGVIQIKPIPGQTPLSSLRLSDCKSLISVKRHTITSMSLSGGVKSVVPLPVEKWKAPELHKHFQTLVRKHYQMGYGSLSVSEKTNWKLLQDGFSPSELVEAMEYFIEKYHSELVHKISTLPTEGPSVGIFRGWMPSIAQLVWGKGIQAKPVGVREWGSVSQEEGEVKL